MEFLNGPSQATAWPVRRVMSLIGSASGCKFRLTDTSVSRFHGSFLRTSAGLWIVDLLGQGGITVNEVPVRFSHLADGDLLRIGRYQIQVRCRPGRQGTAKELPDPPARRLLLDRLAVSVSPTDLSLRIGRRPRYHSCLELRWRTRAQFPLVIPALSSLTNIELMAPEANFPLKLTPSGLTESMLVPLMNQFGFMQQQMFDQFQQAMAMMVQMFGTMHRDQMEMIRAELDGLHDLTEEFHALNKELANRTQERDSTVASAPTIAPERLDGSITTAPIASGKTTDGGPERSESYSGGRKAGDATSILGVQHGRPTIISKRWAFLAAANFEATSGGASHRQIPGSGSSIPGQDQWHQRFCRFRTRLHRLGASTDHDSSARTRDPLAEDPQTPAGGLLTEPSRTLVSVRSAAAGW